VATLKLLLARVGASLDPTEAWTPGGLELSPTWASFSHDSTEQKSSMVYEDHLYGYISPRGSSCLSPQPIVSYASASESKGMDGTLALVLQITLELQELCEEYSMELPLDLVSFEALAVTPAPSPPQNPTSEVSGEVLAHSSEALLV
jgi:hypothetical protein